MKSVNRIFELSLIAMLASGFFALASSGYLDLPTIVIGSAALALRTFGAWRKQEWRLPNSTVTMATLVYIAFFFVDYYWISKEFLPATVHLIIYLAVVKLFTARTSRDFGYLYMIAFLEMIAASILSANTAFLPAMASFLFFAVATFASAEIRNSGARKVNAVRINSRIGWRLIAVSGSITAGILLMSAALFFLLPRTARAAFQHLIPERYHITGFSNDITLGRIGELKRQSTPVMHVRDSTGSGKLPALRWRGATFRRFDGRRWINPATQAETLRSERGLIRLAPDEQRWRAGPRVAYEVHLQNLTSATIFVAGIPEFLRIHAAYILRSPDATLRNAFSTSQGIRYGVHSFLGDTGPLSVAQRLPLEARIEHLLLPATDPAVISLAQALGTPRAMEAYLKQHYGYSLDLPATAPEDPIHYFLFERREGHCEYFASAMAVMLRAAGIPSRVVTGFYGGVWNPVSGWHVIRASDAHSWVEAWEEGKGWVTYDPTPPDPNAAAPGFRDKLALWTDALETFWQDWVLSYNRDQQLSLAAQVEHSRFRFATSWNPDWSDLLNRWAPWIGGAAALMLLLRLWRRRSAPQRRVPESARLYEEMLAILRRRGIEKPAWLTPREFVSQLPLEPWRSTAAEITEAYYRFRYAQSTDAQEEMRMLLKRL